MVSETDRTKSRSTLILSIDWSLFVGYFSLVVLIVFSILSIVGTNLLNISVIIFLIGIGFFVFVLNKLLISIRIDRNDNLLTLYFLRFLFFKKKEAYNIANIDCSYKEEVRSRGVKVKVLRVTKEHITILELIPSKSGWSVSKVEKIFNILSKIEDL